jgi:hypothetical protein
MKFKCRTQNEKVTQEETRKVKVQGSLACKEANLTTESKRDLTQANGVVDGKPVNIPAPVHTKSDGEL